jgi:hypothetical protein
MSEHDQKREVKIFIDERHYHSPTATTGAALYTLGNVAPGMVLYRELRGDRPDPEVPNAPEVVHLKEDEHFHSGKPREFTIVVEGTPHEWGKPTISYAEVVTLFDPGYPQHPEITYSVRYKRGPARDSEGILEPSGSVKVKDGMVFNVSPTGQS